MKQPTINPDLPVELTVMPNYQTQPFVIAGDYTAVMPYAEQAQKQDARLPKQRKVATKAIEGLQSTLESKVGNLTTRIATDLTAGLYDRRNGTQFLDMLKQRRQDEKDMAMARKLGLVAHTHCAKHEKQLAEVRGIR